MTLFLDQWAIINLLQAPSCMSQRERLVLLCKSGACTLVLTIWYVQEAIRDGNKDRAIDLCKKIEMLSKEVPCVWIRLKTDLQEDEVAEDFFNSIGIPYCKRSPFCEGVLAIFPELSRHHDIENIRKEGLVWFFKRPKLFHGAFAEQSKYPSIKSKLKSTVQATVGRKGLSRQEQKQFVQMLLPSQFPGGLVIADGSKRQYLQAMNIKKFRALAFEAALSDATTADTQAHPTEQDLVDLQHAVSVVPYADVVVLDAKFRKYALTVRKNWKGKEPLAECFDNVDAALDWIEKQAVKY
ncbi:MAG: hypothetical protein P0120_17995 [Nitrospira sp.]|nr:hypothetical protein [Nitrospira sp.]